MNATQPIESNIVPLPKPSKESPWVKTKYANLIRYKSSGYYFVRARIAGHHIRQSLKTQSITIAVSRMNILLAKERQRLGKRVNDDDTTFGDLAAEYLAGIAADEKLKPRSKKYREETLRQLKDTWPELYEQRPSDITGKACIEWANKAKVAYSPTRFNGTVETLRRIILRAIAMGLLAEDPTANLERASIKRKERKLPDAETLNRIWALLKEKDNTGEWQRKYAYWMVSTMLFTFARIGSIRKLKPEHIDFKKNQIAIPPIKYSDQPIYVPIFDEFRPLLETMVAEHIEGPLIPIKNPRRTLRTIGKILGLKLDNHFFRHLSTTLALEKTNSDIKTVAEWRGDKDGGAMLLKTYSHPRYEHHQGQAKKIKLLE